MSEETGSEEKAGSAGNLVEFLDRMKAQGITQREVAGRAKVPVQYLSDVKTGSRTFTELFARRLAEEFGVDYRWLLGQSNSISPPRVNIKKSGDQADKNCLPVFGQPIEGDPTAHQDWDGATIEVVGAAAARSRQAKHPYILRIDFDDRRGRLCRNDLVLISQEVDGPNAIHIIKIDGELVLARRVSSVWELLTLQKRNLKLAASAGIVLGIIWGATR